MVDTLSLIQPYQQSHAHDATELALKQIFITAFTQLFNEKINNIHDYGKPFLGGPAVVERFSKQDGLVVLRRAQSSDLLMRVIYANWRSLASKRGLAFLDFVLKMLWSDQYSIQRLYHSYTARSQYPNLVTNEATTDSFLTSRILVLMDDTVDVNELKQLKPTLERLVPARVVPMIGVKINIANFGIAVAVAGTGFAIGSNQYSTP